MTVTLIAICAVVAVVSQLGSDTRPVAWMFFNDPPRTEQIEERLIALEEAGDEESAAYEELWDEYERLHARDPEPLKQVARGQVWRLITPMFLHFGVMHILFNMMWLWTLGRPLEHELGKARFLLVVAAIAVCSNIAEALLGGTNFGGMSGVIYGLFGLVVVHGRLHPAGILHLDPRTVRFMIIWLVLCFTGFLGPIANWAHLFGLFSGGLIGAGIAMRSGGWKRMQRRRDFRKAFAEGSGAIHTCAVCGKTEMHDSDLEFRVCTDGHEYCQHHQPQETTTPSAGG
ncbi:MAG: rhomboid family intramembrane serine protease [Akkermansiaceae bacterium]|nr:rhomboid family intramembrane serine protease [Akkermansiaceae bacterium]